MFLLTPVCLRVCGCVCERETCLLLFPNLTSPLSLPWSLYALSLLENLPISPAHPRSDWDVQLAPPRCTLNHLEDGATMCPSPCPTLGAHTYPEKCETSGFCLCQPSLAPTVTGLKPQPDLPPSAQGGHRKA